NLETFSTRRTGSAGWSLDTFGRRVYFLWKRFQNVGRPDAERADPGASVPRPPNARWLPDWGGPGILGGPSCSKAMIRERSETTGRQLRRPPGLLGFLETARYSIAGR